MMFEYYVVFKKNSRGVSVQSYMKKPTVKPDEVSMRMCVDIPNEMFTRPTIECKISPPPHRVNDISVNKDEIEKSISKITGTKITMTVNEIVT